MPQPAAQIKVQCTLQGINNLLNQILEYADVGAADMDNDIATVQADKHYVFDFPNSS